MADGDGYGSWLWLMALNFELETLDLRPSPFESIYPRHLRLKNNYAQPSLDACILDSSLSTIRFTTSYIPK